MWSLLFSWLEVNSCWPSPSSANVEATDHDDFSNSGSNNEKLQEGQEQRSSSGSSETEYNLGSNSGSNDEEDDINNDMPLLPQEIEDLDELDFQEIRRWALKSRISLTHLHGLLKVLRVRMLPNLPKTAKTFLRPVGAKYNIEEMGDANGGFGAFVYFGVESGLQECGLNLVRSSLYEFNVKFTSIQIL